MYNRLYSKLYIHVQLYIPPGNLRGAINLILALGFSLSILIGPTAGPKGAAAVDGGLVAQGGQGGGAGVVRGGE